MCRQAGRQAGRIAFRRQLGHNVGANIKTLLNARVPSNVAIHSGCACLEPLMIRPMGCSRDVENFAALRSVR